MSAEESVTPASEEPSPVDRYLDELFDDLAGTGAAGRRAMAEAEDHLRAAADDGVSRGVLPREAERDAVARFGPPGRIAGQLRRAHGRFPSGSVLSGGWLLAGVAILAIGATYALKAVDIAVLSRMHPSDVPQCPDDLDQILRDRLAAASPGSVVEYGPCTTTVSTMHDNTRVGLALLALGLAVLAARWLAVRWARMAPAPARLPLVAARVFALAGVALVVAPLTPLRDRLVGFRDPLFGVDPGPGFHHAIVAAAVVLLASIAATVWHLATRRRVRVS